MPAASLRPVKRYRCTDEDTVEECRQAVCGNQSDHQFDHLLEPVCDENALVLSEYGELDSGKRNVVDPETHPEPHDKALEIFLRDLIDVSSEAVTSLCRFCKLGPSASLSCHK